MLWAASRALFFECIFVRERERLPEFEIRDPVRNGVASGVMYFVYIFEAFLDSGEGAIEALLVFQTPNSGARISRGVCLFPVHFSSEN